MACSEPTVCVCSDLTNCHNLYDDCANISDIIDLFWFRLLDSRRKVMLWFDFGCFISMKSMIWKFVVIFSDIFVHVLCDRKSHTFFHEKFVLTFAYFFLKKKWWQKMSLIAKKQKQLKIYNWKWFFSTQSELPCRRSSNTIKASK